MTDIYEPKWTTERICVKNLDVGDYIAMKGWTDGDSSKEAIVLAVKHFSIFTVRIDFKPPAVGPRFFDVNYEVRRIVPDVFVRPYRVNGDRMTQEERSEYHADLVARLENNLWPYNFKHQDR